MRVKISKISKISKLSQFCILCLLVPSKSYESGQEFCADSQPSLMVQSLITHRQKMFSQTNAKIRYNHETRVISMFSNSDIKIFYCLKALRAN